MPVDRIYIESSVAQRPDVEDIVRRIEGAQTSIVEDSQTVYDAVLNAKDPVSRGKQVLYLTQNRGPFVRNCPGTRNYTCCGYRILHVGTYCVMDCAYCILQSYFHPPVLQFFVNHDDMHRELARLFAEERISRIGTGEFTDSLIWERWTPLCGDLIDIFAGQDRAVLELKTKTTAVAGLLDREHRQKTIMAWSLNTERIIAEEERNTASLEARLTAAAKCADRGYPLAFHFDPMMIYEGCKAEYRQVVDRLFARIPSSAVAWISMGTFRFMPALRAVVERRFPRSKIIYGEFVPGLDGKMRYFSPLRIGLYREVAEAIRAHAPDVTLYLCMEDEKTWQRSLGFFPPGKDGLNQMLDEAAVRHCGLLKSLARF